MCTAQPELINAQGSTLSDSDKDLLFGGSVEGGRVGNTDPKWVSQTLFNWLTVGGLPKTVEPGKIFKEQSDMAGVVSKGDAGKGIAGLFGAGLLIGDLIPDMSKVQPNNPLSQLNKSPMQTGVPYSTTPMVKIGRAA
jgi:hypothetical protein